ncbi:MAG: coenzyme F430 synthase [Methanosarcina sp.]|nr:UDP-N-acetylmuramoylalanine ligase [Methanosarcina sp. Ant1]
MDLYRKKLAVLDLTHGGIPIAKKLAALGNDVTGVDVYGTVDPSLLLELEKKHGIQCSKNSLPASKFDFLVAPVHLDSAYPMLAEARAEGKRVFSHHEIVGKILIDDSRLSSIKTIEVTGVKAKTSTASLLADMLSRRFEVVLHTSKGLEAWKGGISSLIGKGLSITPGSILVAVERVFEAGFRPDFFIFEISIGGTGTADLGILTTLSPDYGIANNTALASEAKLQLIRNAKPGSTLLLNSRAEKALVAAKTSQAKVLTFKDPFNAEFLEKSDEAADFTLETSCKITSPSVPQGFSASSIQSESSELPVSIEYSGSVLHFMYRGDEIFSVSLLPGYNISAYKTAFIAASAAALELEVELEAVVAVLEEFRGLSGRMQEKELNGIALIDNSNSGMDILSAEKALEYALLKKKDEKKRGIILVLGEEASQVCEGLPPASVQNFVEKFGIKCRQIILVGERMKTVVARNTSYADSLPEGLSKASELAGGDDIILSSVKCFR